MVDLDRLKLFVGGLPRETSDVALREHFSRYGDVVECVVAVDRTTGTRRGFGFVTFGDSDAFERALGDCHVILQRRVDVKQAIPRSEQFRNEQHSNGLSRNSKGNNHMTSNNSQFKTKKIFVGGLSPIVTENDFKSYFEQFGSITDVVVMHDNTTNRPRGFGFITFDSEEIVEEVTRKSFHELCGKLVEVKRAVPKDEVSGKGNHRSRVENGISSFSDHQSGNYAPYPDACSSLPVHRPITTGYGGTLGYTYGPPIPFGPVFPVGGFYGVSYDVAHVGPTSPLISPPPHFGFRGSPMPLGSVSTFYPAYSNSGVAILGMPNGVMYNGFPNLGMYKDTSELGNGGHVEANLSSVQITEIENNGGATVVGMNR